MWLPTKSANCLYPGNLDGADGTGDDSAYGGIVGFVVMAIMLPIFQLNQMVH